MAEDRCRLGGRERCGEGALSGLADFVVGLLLDAVQNFGAGDFFMEQIGAEILDRVAHGFGVALGLGTVQTRVIGVRVGVGADDVAVDERGPFAGAAVGDGRLEGLHADDGVGAVDFFEMEMGERREKVRDIATGRVDFNGDRDGVAVVFDDEEHGELAIGGDADGFPELALGGCAFADGDVDDLVAVEVDGVELTVVGVFGIAWLCGFRMLREVERSLRTTDGLQALRGRGG